MILRLCLLLNEPMRYNYHTNELVPDLRATKEGEKNDIETACSFGDSA